MPLQLSLHLMLVISRPTFKTLQQLELSQRMDVLIEQSVKEDKEFVI